MAEKQGSKTISTKLERIAEIAKRMPGVALTSLSHHIDMDWMREAHRRTRKDGAAGVDKDSGRVRGEHRGEARVTVRPSQVS